MLRTRSLCRRSTAAALALVLACGLPCTLAYGQCAGSWDTSFCPLGVTHFSGSIGHIKCMTVYNDGRGEALYIGGSFELVNGQVAYGLARWDGFAWEATPGVTNVSTGASNGYAVQAMTVHDDGTVSLVRVFRYTINAECIETVAGGIGEDADMVIAFYCEKPQDKMKDVEMIINKNK